MINLKYRLKRLFQGESGVVERVNEAPNTDGFGQFVKYWKDDTGNFPKSVTFRNPLSELVTVLSSMVLMPTETFKDKPYELTREYKQYQLRNQFP